MIIFVGKMIIREMISVVDIVHKSLNYQRLSVAEEI